MPFPDFICVGAQKAGTTWLHHQMAKHPQVWLPPVKELHYFDRPEVKRLISYVFKSNSYGTFVRHLLFKTLTFRDSLWNINFIFSARYKPLFYPSLFAPAGNQISGEFTPSYGRLDSGKIKEVASLMPDCRIIYLIRNPVERAWSQINMFGRTKKLNGLLSDKDLSPVKRSKMIKNSCSYTNLQRWEKHFGNEQTFVGFFEQIRDQPEFLLSSICSFLKIEPGLLDLTDDIYKPKNQGQYSQMPVEVEQRLTKLFMPEIQKLHTRFDNTYTNQWLERANKVLQ